MAPPRKIAFVTAATDHGPLIVNRFDAHSINNRWYGVGLELLENSARETNEVNLTRQVLDLRRHYYGDGVVAVDCGANIGIYTVEWSKHMTGWGSVVAIEAQERIYYALGGNIAINNCFNARAMCAAVGRQPGVMKIPNLDHLSSASFGSLELKQRERNEFIGQKIDYAAEKDLVDIRVVSLDSLDLGRVDLVKIDVEGMEIDVLEGAVNCIAKQHPVILVEWIKNDKEKLKAWLEKAGYVVRDVGMNFFAVHQSDKCLAHLKG